MDGFVSFPKFRVPFWGSPEYAVFEGLHEVPPIIETTILASGFRFCLTGKSCFILHAGDVLAFPQNDIYICIHICIYIYMFLCMTLYLRGLCGL